LQGARSGPVATMSPRSTARAGARRHTEPFQAFPASPAVSSARTRESPWLSRRVRCPPSCRHPIRHRNCPPPRRSRKVSKYANSDKLGKVDQPAETVLGITRLRAVIQVPLVARAIGPDFSGCPQIAIVNKLWIEVCNCVQRVDWVTPNPLPLDRRQRPEYRER
jgi:hypothetical protein